jgi:cytochrome b involved in lipid metabolism
MDATESFEDVGHSDEAREILKKFYVQDLKSLGMNSDLELNILEHYEDS